MKFFGAVAAAQVLTACSASTAPVVKIGLVAPFEGRYRAIGYEAIYAARLAIREINGAGGVEGYRLELIALDDGGDDQLAIEQARKLALDPQVVAAIGHYRPDTTAAVLGVYCAEGLPALALETQGAMPCDDLFSLAPAAAESSDPAAFLFGASVPNPSDMPEAAAFVAAYNAIPIDGTRAGPIALQTYEAMNLLFDALRKNLRSEGQPSRESMARALRESSFTAVSGAYRFDAAGDRIGARLYVYRYGAEGKVELLP